MSIDCTREIFLLYLSGGILKKTFIMTDKAKLNELNFKELIHIDYSEPKAYNFAEYKRNDQKHNIKGFCTICEQQKINVSKTDENFKLATIGHGTHTLDYAEIIPNFPQISNWREEGVIFLFQTPPQIYSNHFTIKEFNGFHKFPTFKWYFALFPNTLKLDEYPSHFQGKLYDNFILSIINTFKLKNAYVTDLIKCGLCKENDNLNIRHFQDITIKTCISNFLLKEIDLLKPKVIFAFGSDTTEIARKFVNGIPIIQLPHPRARGLSSDYFRTIYYWKILSGLCKVGIIHHEMLSEYMKKYNNE